ncbi:MAG: hypothetical protein Q9195_009301 [Heterodermia aff. obscurata]
MATFLATRRHLIASILTTTPVRSIGPVQKIKRTSIRSFLTSSRPSTTPNFAFAFDIDGVLLRSSTPLPGASRSLRYLQANGIPFILLTNGGGKTEAQRVSDLSRHLDVPIDVDMFIQSHTPFKQLVDGDEDQKLPRLKDECILVLGGQGNECRDVAEGYGFTQVLTPADLITAYPALWPMANHSLYTAHARPIPHRLGRPLRIAAILVFHDPRDWALDIQIIIDLLFSEQGVLGTVSPKNGNPELPNNGWQKDGQPTVYFANPDVVWASEYHLDRLGQGAFIKALAGLFNSLTAKSGARGVGLRRTLFGKPTSKTFAFAERKLEAHRQTLLGLSGEAPSKLETVYMVGDNPASDILGANDYQSPSGTSWNSILVKTGVYKSGKPEYEPKAIVPDVTAAVQWALKNSGWDKPFP